MKTSKALKINDRVKPIEDHDYLGISKRYVGVVTAVSQYLVEVKFINKKLKHRTIGFAPEELRRVK